jgi:hypothetical protein
MSVLVIALQEQTSFQLQVRATLRTKKKLDILNCTCLTLLLPQWALVTFAAINQNAFGQVNGTAGPGCGRCFNIILNTAISDQNYTITDASKRPEVTVKIVDLCPGLAPNLGKTFCLFHLRFLAQTIKSPSLVFVERVSVIIDI